MEKRVIGFIGTGNMSQAVLSGIYNSGLKKRYYLYGYDKSVRAMNYCKKEFRMIKGKNAREVAEESDILFLAVKPPDFKDIAEILKTVKNKKSLIVSVMAGVPIKKIKDHVWPGARTARIMPNMPALIGEGACGCTFEKGMPAAEKKEIESIREQIKAIQ